MDSFTPLTAAIGGGLIGLAAAILWLGNGRIAGISGIFGQLLPPAETVVWRVVFLLSLIGGAWLVSQVTPLLGFAPAPPETLVGAPAGWSVPTPFWIVIAGLLTASGPRSAMAARPGTGFAVSRACRCARWWR